MDYAEIDKVISFIKSLDDEGIEIFIKVAKEQYSNVGDENKFRSTLKEIRDSE